MTPTKTADGRNRFQTGKTLQSEFSLKKSADTAAQVPISKEAAPSSLIFSLLEAYRTEILKTALSIAFTVSVPIPCIKHGLKSINNFLNVRKLKVFFFCIL